MLGGLSMQRLFALLNVIKGYVTTCRSVAVSYCLRRFSDNNELTGTEASSTPLAGKSVLVSRINSLLVQVS